MTTLEQVPEAVPSVILIDREEYNFDFATGVACSPNAVIEEGTELDAGPRTIIRSPARLAGKVVMGIECDVYGQLTHSTLGDNVRIDPEARLTKTTVGNNTIIGSRTVTGRASIGSDNIIGAGVGAGPGFTTKQGVNVGLSCIFGARTELRGGVSIGEGSIFGDDTVIGADVRVGIAVRGEDGVVICHGSIVGDETRLLNDTTIPPGTHLPALTLAYSEQLHHFATRPLKES